MAYADTDAAIRKCVDDIWNKYDKHGSGCLDKEETQKFVQNTFSVIADLSALSDADFDAVFKDFDKEQSYIISYLHIKY